MTKPKNPDIMALERCAKALEKSTSRKMLEANLRYLWDRYIGHPAKEVQELFRFKKV